MNLISCDGCGVIFDKDKLKFPKDMDNEDGNIDDNKAEYNQLSGEFEVYVPCPVCKSPIFGGRK